MSKEWLVFILNLLVKNMYKFYLPVSRRGKNRGGRCRVLFLNLLVILLVCE